MGISRRIGHFRLDRAIVGMLLLAGIGLAGQNWLAEHPEHNPWAPLSLAHPIGWATKGKLDELREDPEACHAVLDRSDVLFSSLDPVGEGNCLRSDRLVLTDSILAPADPQMTCSTAAGLELWVRQGVDPAAREAFGTGIARIDHLGTFNCRRINDSESANWSEHATGNAIDIAGFVLEDGRRISLLQDWEGDDDRSRFLRQIRDSACSIFGSVLSPDYNSAHADHFHLDQADRIFGGVCR